jgi:hypothetical protein
MARRERLLRGKLGLPQGLIERAEATKPSRSSSAGTRKATAKAKRP